MSYTDILGEEKDGVAWITINRPEVRNTLRTKPVAELTDALLDARCAQRVARRQHKGPVRDITAALGSSSPRAFLLGNDARYVNGHDLVVDGGVSGNFLGRLPGIGKIPRG